jgi:hypothetical protein
MPRLRGPITVHRHSRQDEVKENRCLMKAQKAIGTKRLRYKVGRRIPVIVD